MKGITKFLLVSGIVIMLFGALSKTETASAAARTCVKPGCDRKCDSGQIYCYRHRTYDYSGNKKKSTSTKKSSSTYNKNNNSNSNKGSYKTTNRKKLTPKSYYTDDMPDCDDYDNWGDFMDDWDGNMPDGSDASDYWDNW